MTNDHLSESSWFSHLHFLRFVLFCFMCLKEIISAVSNSWGLVKFSTNIRVDLLRPCVRTEVQR